MGVKQALIRSRCHAHVVCLLRAQTEDGIGRSGRSSARSSSSNSILLEKLRSLTPSLAHQEGPSPEELGVLSDTLLGMFGENVQAHRLSQLVRQDPKTVPAQGPGAPQHQGVPLYHAA